MPLEPKPPAPEPANGVVKHDHRYYLQRQLEGMSPERKLEIASFYEDRRIPSYAITKAYGINNSLLTAVVDEMGLPRRGMGNNQALEPGHFEPDAQGKQTWVLDAPEAQPEPTVPEPQQKALERMLRLPPKPEPAAQPVPRPAAQDMPSYVEQVLPDETDASVWKIDYLGSMLVRARDIDQALERARADGHLTQIVGVTMRSR
jgi:hypothetical protein